MKVIIATIGVLVACMFAGVIVTNLSSSSEKYVADVTEDTQVPLTPLELRIDKVYNSEEFQKEMVEIATARAMFELSSEKQREALDLSKQAMDRYLSSKDMFLTWYNSIDYVGSPTSTIPF